MIKNVSSYTVQMFIQQLKRTKKELNTQTHLSMRVCTKIIAEHRNKIVKLIDEGHFCMMQTYISFLYMPHVGFFVHI